MAVNEDKGITGFKQSEFAAATPDRVFGADDVRTEELPDGVRLYLKEKAIDLGTKKVVSNVYRIIDDGGSKNKRVWVGKIPNRKPEEDEMADMFGGGQYIWIMKWVGKDMQERGIVSDIITIDSEFGDAAHAAWKRKQSAPAVAAPSLSVAAPAPAPAFGGDAAVLLQIMEAAEERTFARIERIAGLFSGNRSETPADVLKSAYQGASDMMRQAVETNYTMAKSVNRANQLAVQKAEEGDTSALQPGADMPGWLQAFMPHIEKGLGKLLDAGPVMQGAMKTLIISSDEWAQIMSDPEKQGQAIAAIERTFGSEKTRRALNILFDRKAEDEVAPTGKPKKGRA